MNVILHKQRGGWQRPELYSRAHKQLLATSKDLIESRRDVDVDVDCKRWVFPVRHCSWRWARGPGIQARFSAGAATRLYG